MTEKRGLGALIRQNSVSLMFVVICIICIPISGLSPSYLINEIITRMGRNAKFVITGDITQIDLPRHQQSGLVQAMRILDGIGGISFIHLDNSDVIRHKLVTKIIRAYERHNDNSHEEPPQLQD